MGTLAAGDDASWRVTARENLRLDESLFAAGAPAVRVAVLSDQSVSLGVAQPENTPSAVRARSTGIPVLRRSSGGSGLLLRPGDLVWSIVLPRTDRRVGRNFVTAYARLGAGVVDFLAGLKIDSEWATAFALSGEFCLFGPRGRVLAVDGRAVGGAAQHVSSQAVLHHGTVLRTVDRALTAQLFELRGEVLDRKLTGLAELGATASDAELAAGLRAALAQATGTAGGTDPAAGFRSD